jgi:hypothetical protein
LSFCMKAFIHLGDDETFICQSTEW